MAVSLGAGTSTYMPEDQAYTYLSYACLKILFRHVIQVQYTCILFLGACKIELCTLCMPCLEQGIYL